MTSLKPINLEVVEHNTGLKSTELRNRIGLKAVPVSSPESGVVMDWSTLPLSSFERSGWAFSRNSPDLEGGGEVSCSWRAKYGSGNLRMKVIVSSVGPEATRERLIFEATTTTTTFVSHVRGPLDLGDISAVFVHQESPWLLWAFKNVCVSLDANNIPYTEVLALAHGIQSHMAGHVVPDVHAFAPRVERIEPATAMVPLGGQLTLKAVMAPTERGRRLLVDLNQRGVGIAFVDSLPDGETVSFERAYSGPVWLQVADPVTLLSTSVAAMVTVK